MSLCLKISLHGLRQHKINVMLLRVTCCHNLLANEVCHRGYLRVKELIVSYMLPDSYLSGGRSLWCPDYAWHRVQSAAHRCMSSLYLTSQVDTVTHWRWACIQCSFHWKWWLLERNKHSLKGYGCTNTPELWKSQAIALAKENPVGLYVTFDSVAHLTHHCWYSFTSFTLATLIVTFQRPKDGS